MDGREQKNKTAKNLLEGKNCSCCKHHQFYYGGVENCDIDMYEVRDESFIDMVITIRKDQVSIIGNESCKRWEDGCMYSS